MKKLLVMIMAVVLMLNMSVAFTAFAAETCTTPDGGAKTEFSAETYGSVYGGNGSALTEGIYNVVPGDTLKFTVSVTNDGTYKLTSTQTVNGASAYKVWINEIYMDMIDISTGETVLGSYELFAGNNVVELKPVTSAASVDVQKISLERTGAITGDKLTIHYTNSGHIGILGSGFDEETQFTAVGCDFKNIIVPTAGDYKVYLSTATNVEGGINTYMQFKTGSGSYGNASTIVLPNHGSPSPYDVTYLGDIKLNANEAAALRIQPTKAARFRGLMLEKIKKADEGSAEEVAIDCTLNSVTGNGGQSAAAGMGSGATAWYNIKVPADGNYRVIANSVANTAAANADLYIGMTTTDYSTKVGTITVTNTGWSAFKDNETVVELYEGEYLIGVNATALMRLSSLTIKQIAESKTIDCTYNTVTANGDQAPALGMGTGATAWYDVTVPSGGNYKATISASANTATVAADVYVGTSTTDFSTKVGTIMVSNTGWGAGQDSETIVTLPAGTYLIGINASNTLMRLYGLTLEEAGDAKIAVEAETKLYLDEAVAGKAMTSLRNGSIIVNTTVNTDAIVIAALYEGDMVKDAKVCDFANNTHTATLDASAENVTNIGNCYVKVFVWDSLTGLTPLTNVFSR